MLCAPGINCYSCPGAITACPLGSLQGAISADNKSSLFYVGGILLLYAILFGRMICGWFCPFGLIQELVHKIKTPKLKKNKFTRILSYLKYVILVFFAIIVPIAYAFRDTPVPGFCKYICPAGTLEGALALLPYKTNEKYLSMLGPIFTWKFALMISIIVGCVFIFRLFCRFICPLGALYGLFNKISVFGVKVEESKCTHCNLCVGHCKMDVKEVGDQECISCGECINVCPTQAIKWKGTGLFRKNADSTNPSNVSEKTKKAKLITRSISAGALVAFLIGVIAYYWITTPDYTSPNSYNITLMNENGISTETIDPATTGKITIVNFWGTWCGPCKAELPYFDEIATNYSDTVTVVAIHSNMLAVETAPDYIKENYANSKMIFAVDEATDDIGMNGAYYLTLGGAGTYPYTVILDENGEIVQIFTKALHYEDLEEVVEQLLNE